MFENEGEEECHSLIIKHLRMKNQNTKTHKNVHNPPRNLCKTEGIGAYEQLSSRMILVSVFH